MINDMPAGVRELRVFACGDCRDKSKYFIGYLETYTKGSQGPDRERKQDARKRQAARFRPEFMQAQMDGHHVSVPESDNWVPMMSQGGYKIQQDIGAKLPQSRPAPDRFPVIHPSKKKRKTKSESVFERQFFDFSHPTLPSSLLIRLSATIRSHANDSGSFSPSYWRRRPVRARVYDDPLAVMTNRQADPADREAAAKQAQRQMERDPKRIVALATRCWFCGTRVIRSSSGGTRD